jgi:hypothetical protein
MPYQLIEAQACFVEMDWLQLLAAEGNLSIDAAAAGFVRHQSLGVKRSKTVDGQTVAVALESRRDLEVIVGKRFVELV